MSNEFPLNQCLNVRKELENIFKIYLQNYKIQN